MELFIFNPINNKTPAGTSTVRKKIKYELKIAKSLLPTRVDFVYYKENESPQIQSMICTHTDDVYFHYTFSTHYQSKGHYWYYFKVKTKKEEFYLDKGINFNVQKTHRPHHPYLQLIHMPITLPDKKMRKGIIYHIFIDRFCSVGEVQSREGLSIRKDWGGEIKRITENGNVLHNQCFGGNLKGILSKLDYLKSLNTSVIYLSPVFEAHSSHKYDVADYNKIDEMFGTEQDFKDLIKKADNLGIGIILDGVFNHTGADSVYFNKYARYSNLGAYQSPKSEYYKWYSFIEYPDNYESWWGIKSLPQTKDTDKDYLNFICGEQGIIKKYMQMGIKGFRLDVVDELSNNFVRKICSAITEEYKNPLIVGEVWEDASIKISYNNRRKYFLGDQLNSVTNYPVREGIINFVKHGKTEELVYALYTILDQYPREVQNSLMNVLGTHDTARIRTVLGAEHEIDNKKNHTLSKKEAEKSIHLLKMASLLQYTLMGLPTLFYGDEAGMEGAGDPFCRACFPWQKENKELVEWYRKLGALRKEPLFDNGDFKILFAKDSVIVFERSNADIRLIIAVNKSNEDWKIKLTQPFKNLCTKEIYSTETVVLKDDFLILTKGI